jgi:transcriptional regulator with XRE-family HTH domain
MRTLPPALSLAPAEDIGVLLRHWRQSRRMSQLDLALHAECSSRHLSYVENGRARPSREMVMRLADVLEVPLRERNTLLVAAGYAPLYREPRLAAPEMAQVQRAVNCILGQQEPYPAIVIDRHWNLLMANLGAQRLFRFLLGATPTEPNILRLVFREDCLRPLVRNWEELAEDLVRRVQQEAALSPLDEITNGLLEELLASPGVPAHWQHGDPESPASPLMTVVLRKANVELRFFSTFTAFSTPRNVTLDELRIESSFPADEATASFCRSLAEADAETSAVA